MITSLVHSNPNLLAFAEHLVRESLQRLDLERTIHFLGQYFAELENAVRAANGNADELHELERKSRELYSWVGRMAAINRAVAAEKLSKLHPLSLYRSAERSAHWEVQG